jgi:hypothetical protein
MGVDDDGVDRRARGPRHATPAGRPRSECTCRSPRVYPAVIRGTSRTGSAHGDLDGGGALGGVVEDGTARFGDVQHAGFRAGEERGEARVLAQLFERPAVAAEDHGVQFGQPAGEDFDGVVRGRAERDPGLALATARGRPRPTGGARGAGRCATRRSRRRARRRRCARRAAPAAARSAAAPAHAPPAATPRARPGRPASRPAARTAPRPSR